jgi:hypothetical protein
MATPVATARDPDPEAAASRRIPMTKKGSTVTGIPKMTNPRPATAPA